MLGIVRRGLVVFAAQAELVNSSRVPLVRDDMCGLMQHMHIERLMSTKSHDQDVHVVRILAEKRDKSGSKAAVKLREQGRVPGVLFSGEDELNKMLLSFPTKDVVNLHNKIGTYGWACQVFDVEVGDRTYRALGRQIHVTAGSGKPENVTMIAFSSGRHVRVDVPLKLFGKEVSPGIKAGGRVNWIRRTVPCMVSGTDQIPECFEVDISRLDVNDKVLWTELNMPQGVSVLLKDPRQPVLKMARK